jgi:hypothetical protein
MPQLSSAPTTSADAESIAIDLLQTLQYWQETPSLLEQA